jgi:hypothetical protein
MYTFSAITIGLYFSLHVSPLPGRLICGLSDGVFAAHNNPKQLKEPYAMWEPLRLANWTLKTL